MAVSQGANPEPGIDVLAREATCDIPGRRELGLAPVESVGGSPGCQPGDAGSTPVGALADRIEPIEMGPWSSRERHRLRRPEIRVRLPVGPLGSVYDRIRRYGPGGESGNHSSLRTRRSGFESWPGHGVLASVVSRSSHGLVGWIRDTRFEASGWSEDLPVATRRRYCREPDLVGWVRRAVGRAGKGDGRAASCRSPRRSSPRPGAGRGSIRRRTRCRRR